MLRQFTQNNKCEPHGSAKGRGKLIDMEPQGSLKHEASVIRTINIKKTLL